MVDMIRLLATCVSAANRAGHIIREVAQLGRLDVVDKSVHDYQTEADRRAQRCIVSTIASRFPNLRSLLRRDPYLIISRGPLSLPQDLPPSEEDQSLKVNEVNEDVLKEQCPRDFSTVQEKDIVLWVDPLDGTNEFIKGLYEYVTVLIGIAVKGRSVGGVVHQPFWSSTGECSSTSGRTVWGLVGLGVRGVSPLVQARPNMGCTLVATWPPYSDEGKLRRTIESIKPAKVTEVGGAEVFHLLEHRAHAHIMVGLTSLRWDVCAGEGLLRAAGGVATDIHGNLLTYWADSASRKCICGFVGSLDVEFHQQILAQVPQSVKETMWTEGKP